MGESILHEVVDGMNCAAELLGEYSSKARGLPRVQSGRQCA